MRHRSKLTLTFLRHDPLAAARVLQGLETAQAMRFLDTVPARIAAPVLNRMIPFAAARCLEALDAHKSGAALRELDAHERTSLFRLLSKEAREAILAELPDGLQRNLARSLRYPASVVGAWIDANFPVFRDNDLVKVALVHLRGSEATSHIFLESSGDAGFRGAIALVDLISSRRDARLGELDVVAVEPLSNRASLASVRAHPAWNDFLTLPVVGRRRTVLGGLSRRAVQAGLQERSARHGEGSKPIAGALIGALLVSAAGITRLALGSAAQPPGMR